MITLLQIFWNVPAKENVENRSIFGEVKTNPVVYFFDSRVFQKNRTKFNAPFTTLRP